MNKINKIIEREYIKLFNDNPIITTSEMAKKLDVSERTVQRYSSYLGIKLTVKKESDAVKYLKSKGYNFNL